jgi:hypothetical protein
MSWDCSSWDCSLRRPIESAGNAFVSTELLGLFSELIRDLQGAPSIPNGALCEPVPWSFDLAAPLRWEFHGKLLILRVKHKVEPASNYAACRRNCPAECGLFEPSFGLNNAKPRFLTFAE